MSFNERIKHVLGDYCCHCDCDCAKVKPENVPKCDECSNEALYIVGLHNKKVMDLCENCAAKRGLNVLKND
jgi:hypothetical protein